MYPHHESVLRSVVVEHLAPQPGGIYVDATLGNAGHARDLLQHCPEIDRLVGIDCDADAIARARQTLASHAEKIQLEHDNFRNLSQILARLNIAQIDGIVFDLGVSSPQLDTPERGFSFSREGELDMRLDQRTRTRACDIVNSAAETELANLLYDYGQERWSRRIARRIVAHVRTQPIYTTTALAEIIAAAVPRQHHPQRIHPATRSFQALRIAVNDELKSAHTGIEQALEHLRPGGRCCVISFHSLEDRIVKQLFRRWNGACQCPPATPVCCCGATRRIDIITRKPVRPSTTEIDRNPRARSARLRVAQRI